MRIVITGATSMIGVALINECVKNNVSVLAICRPDSNRMNRLPDSDLIKVTFANISELGTMSCDDGEYDVFYHLAWSNTNKITRDDPVLQERNIQYTLDAVELAHKLGCKKFVGAGSQAEYGCVNKVITEETECKPQMAYGMAKLSAKMLSQRLCEKKRMSFVWPRIFSVYGTNDNKDTLIDYALNTFEQNEVASFSSATNIWNYLFESDAGRALYLLGTNDVPNGVYNVASDESRVLKEYILALVSEYGTDVRFSFAQKCNNALNLNVDISKLINHTGFKPTVSFREGIRKVIKSRTMMLRQED